MIIINLNIIIQSEMEQNQINHGLNGYKYSFNRVNPYILESSFQGPEGSDQNAKVRQIQKNEFSKQQAQQSKFFKTNGSKDRKLQQINGVLPSSAVLKNTKQMFYRKPQADKNKILMDLYLRKTRFNNQKVFQSHFQSNVGKVQNPKPHRMNKNLKNSRKVHAKNKSNLSKSDISSQTINTFILTETKQVEYDQNEQENFADQSRERLEKFLMQNRGIQRMGEIPTIVNSKATTPFKIQQEQPIIKNATSQQFTDVHITLSAEPQHVLSPQQQHLLSPQPYHVLSQQQQHASSHIHSSNTKKYTLYKGNHKKSKTTNYKILRNLSEHKFSPYLVSSPNNKSNKSGTTPIAVETRTVKPKSMLKLYPLTSDINPILNIDATSAKRVIRYSNLKINTQNFDQLHNDSQSHDQNLRIDLMSINSPQNNINLLNRELNNNKRLQPLKLQNFKVANQQLSGRRHLGLMGQIKYRSPRMILSSRNQLFKGKNEGPKMKLFTEEEEGNIIKEFYSQEKAEEKDENR